LFGHSPCFKDKIPAFKGTTTLEAISKCRHKLTLFPKDVLFPPWPRADPSGARPNGVYCDTPEPFLFPDSQFLNQGAVALHILLLEIVKEMPSLTDEFQESPPGMVILGMGLEMLRQVIDSLAQDGDLDLGRSRVRRVSLIPLDDGLLPLWQ
jgi:hypothetical protein